MAGRGRGGTTQAEVNLAMLNALTGLAERVQGLGRGNIAPGGPAPFDYARAATNISKSRLGSYSGKVDPEALDLWFRQVEKQFEINAVPHDRKVSIAAHYLEGEADKWWRIAGPTAILAPGFGWNRFMELLEARFIPAELKHRKMEEFMSFRQGTMSVQEYTDKFNKLAHFATPLLPNEAQKAFFFRNGLAAEVAHSVPRAADTVSEIYNAALWGEKSLEKVRKEKTWSAQKRPFQSYTANTPSKRFQPSGGSNHFLPFDSLFNPSIFRISSLLNVLFQILLRGNLSFLLDLELIRRLCAISAENRDTPGRLVTELRSHAIIAEPLDINLLSVR